MGETGDGKATAEEPLEAAPATAGRAGGGSLSVVGFVFCLAARNAAELASMRCQKLSNSPSAAACSSASSAPRLLMPICMAAS